MNHLNPRPVDPRDLPSTTQIRELTSEEVDEVAGGVLPLIGVAAAIVLIAAAVEEMREESDEPEEETGNDD
ncbi:MAG: class IIb bacteriocin, lactobin A/cerein 7B family [Gammaproteobacteria bacterium]|nr:class IIb bacteriocin, lactobin A/cerein 7B family [Gammaproteobacteria bacterium]